jgi:hypothetical protein
LHELLLLLQLARLELVLPAMDTNGDARITLEVWLRAVGGS